MKKLAIVLGTLLTANMGFAQDAIQDRTELTRSSIRTSIEDLRNFNASAGVDEYKDLDAIIQKFTAQVEVNLKNYQVEYENEVIKPVRLMINDYKSVKAANYYKPDEKKALLDDIYLRSLQLASSSSRNFQKRYMIKLANLMADTLEPVIANYNEYRGEVSSFLLVESEDGNYITHDKYAEVLLRSAPTSVILNTNKNEGVSKYLLYKGCYSRGCQTLLSLALNKYLRLLKTLDTTFRVEVDKDKSIEFSSSDNYNFFNGLKLAIDTGHSQFSNVKMNFSLGTQEFDYIQDILEVVNKTQNIADCKAQIQPIKEALCSLGTQNCTSQNFKNILALNVQETQMLNVYVQAQKDSIIKVAKLKAELKELEEKISGVSSRTNKYDRLSQKISDLKNDILSEQKKILQYKVNSIQDRQKCILE